MISKKIVIIGGGNVASHLIRSVTASGHKLVQLYNRTIEHISSHQSETNIVGTIDGITPDADIYIICVKDTAIQGLVKNLRLKDKMIVHTSGNLSMNVLEEVSKNIGIFYPIQSFTKGIPIDFRKVPIIIEANSSEAEGQIRSFSMSISDTVISMSETERQKLNVAGVFVNNFTNHIYTMIYSYLKSENMDFKVLIPLIQNTVDKLSLGAPSAMQTGPAVRNDLSTIESHQTILENYPELRSMYADLTEKIRRFHEKK